MKTFIVGLSLAFFVVGCALPPVNEEQHAAQLLSEAPHIVADGDAEMLRLYIDHIALFPSQARELKEFFEVRPGATDLYIKGAVQYIEAANRPDQFIGTQRSLAGLRSSLPGSVLDPLSERLVSRAQTSNLLDQTPFLLTDHLSGFSLLESDAQMMAILKRSVKMAEKNQDAVLTSAIAAYVADPSIPLSHKRAVENSLDRMHINRADLAHFASTFPDFVRRRSEFLDKAGPAGESIHIVRQSAWDGLSEKNKARIMDNYRVSVNPDANYGAVTDVQTVNRSTAGSNAGSTIGAGVAQIAYVDRSFDNMNYSPWSQLGVGLLGAFVGSAANTAPVEQYQHYYTVRRGNGELFKAEQTSRTPERMAPGTCVAVPNLTQVSQAVCEATPDDLERLFHAAIGA